MSSDSKYRELIARVGTTSWCPPEDKADAESFLRLVAEQAETARQGDEEAIYVICDRLRSIMMAPDLKRIPIEVGPVGRIYREGEVLGASMSRAQERSALVDSQAAMNLFARDVLHAHGLIEAILVFIDAQVWGEEPETAPDLNDIWQRRRRRRRGEEGVTDEQQWRGFAESFLRDPEASCSSHA